MKMVGCIAGDTRSQVVTVKALRKRTFGACIAVQKEIVCGITNRTSCNAGASRTTQNVASLTFGSSIQPVKIGVIAESTR